MRASTTLKAKSSVTPSSKSESARRTARTAMLPIPGSPRIGSANMSPAQIMTKTFSKLGTTSAVKFPRSRERRKRSAAPIEIRVRANSLARLRLVIAAACSITSAAFHKSAHSSAAPGRGARTALVMLPAGTMMSRMPSQALWSMCRPRRDVTGLLAASRMKVPANSTCTLAPMEHHDDERDRHRQRRHGRSRRTGGGKRHFRLPHL